MKQYAIASTVGILALLASSSWTPDAEAVSFTPAPGSGAPSQATGGASRGSLFTPATGRSAPSGATGGASRGGLFKPATGSSSPTSATGGASRGELFKPASGASTVKTGAGGASRGELFKPASNGTPKQAASGASRVGVYQLNPGIVGADGPAAILALLPQTYSGTTISERPTILVYVPASPAQEAVFSLKNQAGETLYQTTLPVSGVAGVMAIALPENAPALTVGQNYQWFLALKMDGQLSPSSPYVDGWVQRIQPSAELAASLKQADPLAQAQALGRHGVWYDCAATLAKLRAADPANAALHQHWSELLGDVGLKEISHAPLLTAAQ